jgi:hypothetical protein
LGFATKYSCKTRYDGVYCFIGGDDVSRKEKMKARLLSRPSDFAFEELAALLGLLGYSLAGSSKTGGSRVAFTDGEGDYIRLHKPHPRNVLKQYQIDDIIAALSERGLL